MIVIEWEIVDRLLINPSNVIESTLGKFAASGNWRVDLLL